MRRILGGLAVASVLGVLVVVALLLSGVIGGGSDPSSADALVQRVAAAIDKPGMVYHAAGDDGSEAWIDAQDQAYRGVDATVAGGLTSVGHGWTRTTYDALNNVTNDADTTPPSGAKPRIDDPYVRWTDALQALAFANQLEYVGRTVSDGREVFAVSAESPVYDNAGNQTGTLFGRVEVDPQTYLPYSFEQRTVDASGATATPSSAGLSPNRRVVYKTSEMIARSSLPTDFFDKSVVEGEVKTNEESLQKIRDIGLTPLWLGNDYQGSGGELQLPETSSIKAVATTSSAEIHYTLVGPGTVGADAVIIRLASDITTFTSPSIPQFGGTLPERKATVNVRGVTGTLYTSVLTRDALPCATSSCAPSTAPLYRRLQFMVGSTAVQIEVSARIDTDGSDTNGYNSNDGIVALAEALTEVPVSTATPTPTPGG